MSHPRLLAPAVGLAAALTAGPFLAASALAADPAVVVQPGDTLTGISRRQGVAIRDIVALNGLLDANRIYVGQRLVLAAPPAAPPAASAPAPPAAAPAAAVHTVARGESLWTIARRYGVSVAALVAANGISNPARIHGGQRLTIPGSAPAPVAPVPTAPPAAPPAAQVPAPAAPAMPASMARLVAQREGMRQLIIAEAQRFGVPPALALAVAWHESGWRQDVVSSAGAVGVMQLMPATAIWVGEAMLGTRVDSNDATQNVRAGVRLLAHYLARYRGDRDLVLAAYYQGQTAADRHGVYPVSRAYVASIRVLEILFGG